MTSIAGATAAVTGGASGLGLATAELLIARGARVVIMDLPGSDGAATAQALGQAASFSPTDITDDASLEAAFGAATTQGELRAVVHCAGRGGDRLRILDRDGLPSPVSSFTEVIRVNLIGTYNVLRYAAASMRANTITDGDRGAIVLTSSVAAFDGQIGQTAYTAAKAGAHGMTLVAARDLAGHAIRANCIAPGLFDTPMLARLPQEMKDKLSSTVPHPQRLGRAEDFAHMALALIENAYINGETVRLDGGVRLAPR